MVLQRTCTWYILGIKRSFCGLTYARNPASPNSLGETKELSTACHMHKLVMQGFVVVEKLPLAQKGWIISVHLEMDP